MIIMIMVISGWMGHASLHHPLQHVLRVRQLRRCLPLLAQYGHRPDVSNQRLNLRLSQSMLISAALEYLQYDLQYFRYGQYIPIIVLVVTTFTIIEAAGAADEYPALPDTDEVTYFHYHHHSHHHNHHHHPRPG